MISYLNLGSGGKIVRRRSCIQDMRLLALASILISERRWAPKPSGFSNGQLGQSGEIVCTTRLEVENVPRPDIQKDRDFNAFHTSRGRTLTSSSTAKL